MKNRELAIIIAISALIFIMLISNSKGEGSGNYPYNGKGDWIIENETVVRNESFELNGSLIVSSSGKLKLYNVSIEVNSSEENALKVEKGGKFLLKESNIIPSNASNPYKIEIYGEMTLENSFVGGLADNIPPSPPILEEINPKSITNKGTIELKGTASDNKGVKIIEVFITYCKSENEIKEKVKTIQFSQILETRAFVTKIRLKVGINSITARAIDSSGNAGQESEKQDIIMIGGGSKENIVVNKEALELNFNSMPGSFDWITIERTTDIELPKNVIYHDVSWLIESANGFDVNVKAKYEPTHLYGVKEEDLKVIISSSSGWKGLPSRLIKKENALSFYTHFDTPTYIAIVSYVADLSVKDIKLSNEPILKGKTLGILATIENSGKFVKDIDVNKTIKIEFVALDISSNKRFPIETVEMKGKFESNSEKEVKVYWRNIEKDGIFEIIVIIDPYHEILEHNLENNRKNKNIEVIDVGLLKNENEKKEKEEKIVPSSKIIVIGTITGFGIVLVWIKRYGILIPLYSRIKKSDLLNNKIRERIHNRILAHPGENLGTIKNALKLNNGAVIHHLTRLEKEGFIKSQREGMYRRFYPNGVKLPNVEAIQEKIQKIIQQKEGITQSEIAMKLGVSRQVINYHIKSMIKKGILRLEKNGRESKCFLSST